MSLSLVMLFWKSHISTNATPHQTASHWPLTDKTALRDLTASAVSAVNAALLSTASYDLLTSGTAILSNSLEAAKEFGSKVRSSSIQLSSFFSADEVGNLFILTDSSSTPKVPCDVFVLDTSWWLSFSLFVQLIITPIILINKYTHIFKCTHALLHIFSCTTHSTMYSSVHKWA